jgi:myosin heavy subunit
MLTIDGVDDVEEMRLTDEAFDILGFSQVSIHENHWIFIFFI